MNILFDEAQHSFTPGGGTIKMHKLREYLQKAGVHVELLRKGQTDLKTYDIYHRFTCQPSDVPDILAAKECRLKVVLETMYWIDWNYLLFMPFPSRWLRLRASLNHCVKYIFPYVVRTRRVMMLADMLMPNSEIEARMIMRQFRIPREKIFVVHNGVDSRFAAATQ